MSIHLILFIRIKTWEEINHRRIYYSVQFKGLQPKYTGYNRVLINEGAQNIDEMNSLVYIYSEGEVLEE